MNDLNKRTIEEARPPNCDGHSCEECGPYGCAFMNDTDKDSNQLPSLTPSQVQPSGDPAATTPTYNLSPIESGQRLRLSASMPPFEVFNLFDRLYNTDPSFRAAVDAIAPDKPSAA